MRALPTKGAQLFPAKGLALCRRGMSLEGLLREVVAELAALRRELQQHRGVYVPDRPRPMGGHQPVGVNPPRGGSNVKRR